MKKPKRYQLGMMALHEICKYEQSTELLICKCPFMYLVCEIAQDCGRFDPCFQVCVVMGLQEAVEYYLTSLLEDATCVLYMWNASLLCWRTSNWPIISIESTSIIKSVLVSVSCRLCWGCCMREGGSNSLCNFEESMESVECFLSWQSGYLIWGY